MINCSAISTWTKFSFSIEDKSLAVFFPPWGRLPALRCEASTYLLLRSLNNNQVGTNIGDFLSENLNPPAIISPTVGFFEPKCSFVFWKKVHYFQCEVLSLDNCWESMQLVILSWLEFCHLIQSPHIVFQVFL